jgi:Transposase, Mutator family
VPVGRSASRSRARRCFAQRPIRTWCLTRSRSSAARAVARSTSAYVHAVAANKDGFRESLGLDVVTSEDGSAWLAFLRSLVAWPRQRQARHLGCAPGARRRDRGDAARRQLAALPQRDPRARRQPLKIEATDIGARKPALQFECTHCGHLLLFAAPKLGIASICARASATHTANAGGSARSHWRRIYGWQTHACGG